MISSPFLNEKETMYAIQDAICGDLYMMYRAFCGDKRVVTTQYTAKD